MLRNAVVDKGSSYAALLLAMRGHPADLGALLGLIGLPPRQDQRARTFDACADAFAVYEDGVRHHAI